MRLMICGVLSLAVIATMLCQEARTADYGVGPFRIDSFYGAGYVAPTNDPCCAAFAVSRGCTGAVPLTYRNFAPHVFPSVDRARVGSSWYEGAQPIYPPACWWGPPINSGVTLGPGCGEEVYVLPEILPPHKSRSESTAP